MLKILWVQLIVSKHQISLCDSMADEGILGQYLYLSDGLDERNLIGWDQLVVPPYCTKFSFRRVLKFVAMCDVVVLPSIVGGFRENLIFFLAVCFGNKIIIQSEGLDPNRPFLSRAVRFLVYRFSGLIKTSFVSTLLGIGTYSEHLKAFLFCSSFMHFGYFNKFDLALRAPDQSSKIRLLFLGSDDPCKGLEYLLDEWGKIEERHLFSLSIGGTAVTRLQSSTEVELLGVIQQDKVNDLFKEVDVLVAPSSYDGWCAVVSEAVCAGLVVLVSRKAGVSMHIRNDIGNVFEPLPGELRRCLNGLTEFEFDDSSREARSLVGRSLFGPESGLKVLKEALLD